MILKATTVTDIPVFYIPIGMMLLVFVGMVLSFTYFQLWMAFDGWYGFWTSGYLFGGDSWWMIGDTPNPWDFLIKFVGLPVIVACNFVMLIPVVLFGEDAGVPYTLRPVDDDDFFTNWFKVKILEKNNITTIKDHEIMNKVCKAFGIQPPKNTDYGFGHYHLRKRCTKNMDFLIYEMVL